MSACSHTHLAVYRNRPSLSISPNQPTPADPTYHNLLHSPYNTIHMCPCHNSTSCTQTTLQTLHASHVSHESHESHTCHPPNAHRPPQHIAHSDRSISVTWCPCPSPPAKPSNKASGDPAPRPHDPPFPYLTHSLFQSLSFQRIIELEAQRGKASSTCDALVDALVRESQDVGGSEVAEAELAHGKTGVELRAY